MAIVHDELLGVRFTEPFYKYLVRTVHTSLAVFLF